MKKLIISTLVILVCGFAFKADPQGQSNSQQGYRRIFQVAIQVSGADDTNILQSLISNDLKREIRMLGDVEIVGYEKGEWENLIQIHITPIKYESGNTSNMMIVSMNFYTRIGIMDILIEKEKWDALYPKHHPIHYPYNSNILVVDANEIEKVSEIIINTYEEEYLQETRDRWKSYPKDPKKLLDHLLQELEQDPK